MPDRVPPGMDARGLLNSSRRPAAAAGFDSPARAPCTICRFCPEGSSRPFEPSPELRRPSAKRLLPAVIAQRDSPACELTDRPPPPRDVSQIMS